MNKHKPENTDGDRELPCERTSGPNFAFEQAARQAGFMCVAGVDEAGRGPLAGPVVAGAVVFTDSGRVIPGLNDSKKLRPAKRARLYESITGAGADVCYWAIGEASVEEIDAMNILRATHLAMARAVENLAVKADYCLVDGLPVRGLPTEHRAIVKGDGKSLSIAAASILAKVYRDRLMEQAHERYPEYGFAQHHGYGTQQHLQAIRRYGPCALHRRSFAPVAQAPLPDFE